MKLFKLKKKTVAWSPPLAWPKPAEPKPATRIDFADDCEEFGLEHEAETQWSPDDPSDCDLQQCINCGVIYYDG